MNIPRTNVAVDNNNTWIYQLDKSLEDNDAWVNRLNKRVAETKWQDPDCTIFKVPCELRVVDPISYDPRILSLGPYHHGKPHLRAMEELKWRYLKIFLNRNPKRSLEDYIKLVAEMETRTRLAYLEAPWMDSKHWVEMMLLDGCFVVEFFYSGIDPIKNYAWVHTHVLRDMLLLENQLPFFLLVELLKLNSFYSQDSGFLPQITFNKFEGMMPGNIQLSSRLSIDDIDHILHLLYSCMLPECGLDSPRMRRFSIVHRLWKKIWKFKGINHNGLISPPLWVPSVKNHKDAGVVFQKKTKNMKSFMKSFMDITFRRGKLDIPQLQTSDDSNSLFRNLLAFEQCRSGYVCHTNLAAYAYLMDCIINTAADIDMLQQDGIIVSLLGNNDDIARLFNQLGKNVAFYDDHYLVGVFRKIQLHCNKRENKWKASMNQKYCYNPCATASIVAAFFLFLFTITQTVFAVLSYVRLRSPSLLSYLLHHSVLQNSLKQRLRTS